ncbi:MAG: hypothetical protein MPN21_09740 [Thermoanaerobaculia bacterium]|nr:hypothetical protein [Thermoanaerobaculia bacterium]
MSRLDLVPFRLLIDRVPAVVRRHAGQFFWPTALPLLAVGVALAIAQVRWTESVFDTASGGGNMFAFFGLFLLIVVLSLGVYVLVYLALAVVAVDAVAGRQVSMGRAWRFCLRPTVLGTSVFAGIAIGISFTACCIPGLFVAPLLALLVPVMVEEGKVGLDAVSRTIELVRFQGRRGLSDSGWAQSFVVLFVGTILSYAASTVTQGPFVILQQVLLIRQTASGQAADPGAVVGSLWLQVPAQVLGALVTVLVWGYWAFGLALLYFEIRRRKEADDLERAIDDIVVGPTAQPLATSSPAEP